MPRKPIYPSIGANPEQTVTGMRLKAGTFWGFALLALLLAGCDRCGDPVQINIPGAPKTCYDTPQK